MEGPKTIEQEIGGLKNDALRFGLNSVKSDIVGSHPLESATESTRRTHEELKRRILANTYGSAFPAKMDLDKQVLHRFQRPPGAISSSMLGLEAVTGSLDDFGFEDYLNALYSKFNPPVNFADNTIHAYHFLDPRDSETFRPADMHHGMEVRLRLSKGPVCPSFI